MGFNEFMFPHQFGVEMNETRANFVSLSSSSVFIVWCRDIRAVGEDRAAGR